MFRKKPEEVVDFIVKRMREEHPGCHVVGLSGGADSAVTLALACMAYGPKNVLAISRDVHSKQEHFEDARAVVSVLGCYWEMIDGNSMYDDFINQAREKAKAKNWEFHKEGDDAQQDEAYASSKSILTTFILGYYVKYFGGPGGRIIGTGNAEEDKALFYFDKRGDGAVDYSPIFGLLKVEVRLLLLYFAKLYNADIFRKIAHKIPSADLLSNGDDHNDEDQLTAMAHRMGYPIDISYGDCEKTGNVGWAVDFEIRTGMISGFANGFAHPFLLDKEAMMREFKISEYQADTILFLRELRSNNFHKVNNIKGIEREELLEAGLIEPLVASWM